MKRACAVALGLLAAVASSGCGDDDGSDPCAGQDCSGHGECLTDGTSA